MHDVLALLGDQGGGDLIVGEWQAGDGRGGPGVGYGGQRVVQLRGPIGEVALFFAVCRRLHLADGSLTPAPALVTGEEEGVIFSTEEARYHDRPARGDAELVLLQGRIGVTLGIGGL